MCSTRLIPVFHTFWLVICELMRIRIQIQRTTNMPIRMEIRVLILIWCWSGFWFLFDADADPDGAGPGYQNSADPGYLKSKMMQIQVTKMMQIRMIHNTAMNTRRYSKSPNFAHLFIFESVSLKIVWCWCTFLCFQNMGDHLYYWLISSNIMKFD